MDFLLSDLEELLDLINARSNDEMVRPTKARKMFASRACRKSVMIGKALSANQMSTVNFSLNLSPVDQSLNKLFLLIKGGSTYGRNDSTMGKSSSSFSLLLFAHIDWNRRVRMEDRP